MALVKKKWFSVLTLGAAGALGLTACGGGDGSPGTQAPTSYEISLRADKTSLPVNIGLQEPGAGAYAPYTTTMYVSATERDQPVPDGTEFSCNVASGLDSARLYYLNGEDEKDAEGHILPSDPIVLESNAGGASFHVHAWNSVGQAEIRCSVTDAAGNRHVASEFISVGSGGGHAGMPASVVYQAYSLDPKNPNAYPNPGNPDAPDIGYLGTRYNEHNIPNSLGLQVIVLDELDQPVADPARANVQVHIRDKGKPAAQGARLQAGGLSGDVVRTATRNGIADFRIFSGPERGPIMLEITVDHFDNDVTNGIQDPIAQLLSVPVVRGISEELLRMKPLQTIEAIVDAELEPVALESEGGTAPYVWSIKDGDELPAGLQMAESGIIYGKPTEPGIYVVGLIVEDRLDGQDEGTITIVVQVGPLEIKTDGIPSSVGPDFSFAVEATGGVSPYQWELIEKPDGISIDPETGVIKGKGVAEGSHSFVIQVKDSADTPNEKRVNVSITVEAAP